MAEQHDFGDFVAGPAKERKTIPKRQFARLIEVTLLLMSEERYTELKSRHFVGLYCIMHEKLYGVVPEEVRENYKQAVFAASRMFRHEFKEDPKAMLHYVRWVWQRERKRNQTRETDFRISWRFHFGRTLLSDYRVASKRAMARRRIKKGR